MTKVMIDTTTLTADTVAKWRGASWCALAEKAEREKMVSESELLKMKNRLLADVIDDEEEFSTWLVMHGVELIDEILSYRQQRLGDD